MSEPTQQITRQYDGFHPDEGMRQGAVNCETTQRTTCPQCAGKCLVWNVPRWEACLTCAGRGWVLERVQFTRDGEAVHVQSSYVLDELDDLP